MDAVIVRVSEYWFEKDAICTSFLYVIRLILSLEVRIETE